MKYFAIIILAFAASTTASVVVRSGTHMTQAAAQTKLEAAGIHASSSGGCTRKNNPRCTSYDGILSGTVDKVIALKKACGCAITITGGTEVGHAPGKYSHANGYKVDLHHAPGIDSFVTTKKKSGFIRIKNRGRFPQWRSPASDIYCDEGGHWDVTYF